MNPTIHLFLRGRPVVLTTTREDASTRAAVARRLSSNAALRTGFLDSDYIPGIDYQIGRDC